METAKGETLGQRLARLREAAGMTQEELAQKAGVPVYSLRNWEHDHRRPRADATLALAKALGVTVEYLLQAPSSRPARAELRDPPGVRALKRAWDRANANERRLFLAFVDGQGRQQGGEEGAGEVGGRARGGRAGETEAATGQGDDRKAGKKAGRRPGKRRGGANE